MKYAVEMASGDMIYIPCFMMISSGNEGRLRLLPRLRGCSVGITDDMDL
jgi:hypothetical protein